MLVLKLLELLQQPVSHMILATPTVSIILSPVLLPMEVHQDGMYIFSKTISTMMLNKQVVLAEEQTVELQVT
jgi:hypothetical protein